MSKHKVITTLEELVLLPVGSVLMTEEAVAWQSLDPDTWAAYGNGTLSPDDLFAYAEQLRLVFEPEDGEEF